MLNTKQFKSKLGEIIDDDQVLERYIPVTVEKLAEDLQHDEDDVRFVEFCHQILMLYHAKMYGPLNSLKRHYQPFSPDRDTKKLKTYSNEDINRHKQALTAELENVLDKANFETLPIEKVNDALNKKSPYGVEVSVDLSEFEQIRLFQRGTATRKVTYRSWKSFFRQKTSEIPIFRRLFVMLQTKSDHEDGREMYLKVFKNIPHTDLEMLFPNTKIKMTLFDKIKLSITGGGGTVSGIMAMITKLAGAVNPWTIVVATAGFAAVIWRQITNVFFQRTKYMAQIARNLYFFNLTNNAGALAYLADLAVMEECKEVLLAYHTLRKQPGLTRSALDKTIEQQLQHTYGIAIDFEIKDGLDKLQELSLLKIQSDKLSVIDLNPALVVLQNQWQKQLVE